MLNSRTSFILTLERGVPTVEEDGDGMVFGRIAPFLPLYSRNREWPGDPYPDAFTLPRLPLPLLMKVARFNRRIASPRITPVPQVLRITGVTRDNTGAALGNCEVHLFRTATDVEVDQVTSDASGNFTLNGTGLGQTYYIVAYKAGGTDVAGTTVNTLTGA